LLRISILQLLRGDFFDSIGPNATSSDVRFSAAVGRTADVFVQRLRELGWTDGRTIAIEYRWADGSSERFSEIAAEFVRLKVDVINSFRR
jgi:hypothetical protein